MCDQFTAISDYEIEWAARSFDYGDFYPSLSIENATMAQFDPSQYAIDAPCRAGGLCELGDTGPGGGIVVAALSQPTLSGAFLEVAPIGWSLELSTGAQLTATRVGSPVSVEVRGTCDGLQQSEEVPTVFCQEGKIVAEIQSILVGLGHSLEVDGQYGPGTASAVGGFQVELGITSTGLVDDYTYSELKKFERRLTEQAVDPVGNLTSWLGDCSGIDAARGGESGWAWPSGSLTTPFGWGLLNSVLINERCSKLGAPSALSIVMESEIGGLGGWHIPSVFELSLWCAEVTSASLVSLDGESVQFDGCQGFHFYSDVDATLDDSQKQRLADFGVPFMARYPNNPQEAHQFIALYLTSTLDVCVPEVCENLNLPPSPILLDFVTGGYDSESGLTVLATVRPFRWFFPRVRAGIDLSSLPRTYPNHLIE